MEGGRLTIVCEYHARYFADLVRRIAPQRWRMDEAQIEAMDRLEDDYANLREAVQWSLTEENGCLALVILGFGAIFFHDRGHDLESIACTRAALTQCNDADPDIRTRAWFALALQDHQMTDDEHERYLRSALQSEDLELIATAYWQYGYHHSLQRRYDVAQHFYERALQLVPKTEYNSLAGIILSYMGQLAEVRGDFEVAT